MRRLLAGTVLAVALGWGASLAPAVAQVNVGGEVATTFRDTEETDFSNRTFLNYSNFNTLRARIYLDAKAADNVSVFTQILVDTWDFNLYGAYARIDPLIGSYVSAQVGLIPHPIGAWGERTYQFENPLIGTPLPYNYHSAFVPRRGDSLRTVDDLWATLDTRSNGGLPVIYDGCWNTGAEFYGSAGKLDYSVGVLTGSVSYMTIQDQTGSVQPTLHLAYNFSPGLRLGGSAYYGPYLYKNGYNDSLPTGTDYADFINAGAGYELYLAHRMLEVHSEGFFSYWEHPYLPRLDVLSGYAEGKYTVMAGWYVAGRFDWFLPADVTNAAGETKGWDYDVLRYEVGLGYKPNRATVMKLVGQFNRFADQPTLDHDLAAFQIVVGY